MPRISKGVKNKWLVNLLKSVILLLMAYTLGTHLTEQDLQMSQSSQLLMTRAPELVVILLVLCGINWSLESMKWRYLTRPIATISFTESLRGVLSGLSMSLLVPMGIGDNLGRLGYLKGSKLKGITMGYLGGMIQMMVTATFGLWGISYLVRSGVSLDLNAYLLLVVCMMAVILVAIYWSRPYSGMRISHVWRALGQIKGVDLLMVTLFSIMRYMVFVLQLFILFQVGGLNLSADIVLAGITWIFICKSVIPAFNFLSDLGVREFSAVLFFGLYDVPAIEVIIPVTFLWLINIFLPSVLGMYYLAQVKLVPARSNHV